MDLKLEKSKDYFSFLENLGKAVTDSFRTKWYYSSIFRLGVVRDFLKEGIISSYDVMNVDSYVCFNSSKLETNNCINDTIIVPDSEVLYSEIINPKKLTKTLMLSTIDALVTKFESAYRKRLFGLFDKAVTLTKQNINIPKKVLNRDIRNALANSLSLVERHNLKVANIICPDVSDKVKETIINDCDFNPVPFLWGANVNFVKESKSFYVIPEPEFLAVNPVRKEVEVVFTLVKRKGKNVVRCTVFENAGLCLHNLNAVAKVSIK